ncbi:MAG: hypothetical protein RL326_195 [Pseudomonadota bacterium]|jgi:hypothetical protein
MLVIVARSLVYKAVGSWCNYISKLEVFLAPILLRCELIPLFS